MFLRLGTGCGTGLSLLLLVGCAGSGFSPVHGKLVYPDDSPVTDMKNAQVVFEGVGANGKGYSAAGTIDADGKFTLTSERPGDGAVPGKNKVLIAPYIPDPERPPPKILDPKFEKFETSGLEADVKLSGSNEFTFTVDRIKPPEPKKEPKK